MAALALVEDLEARTGRTYDDADLARAVAVLDDVSARVRAYTGQQFTLEETTDRLKVQGAGIRLPQRPVTAVESVLSVGGDTITFDWDHGDRVELAGAQTWRSFEVVPFTTRTQWVDVTYTHGYATVPADIVAVVCQIAGRAMGRPSEEAGVTQESIAGYSYSVGVAAAAGPLGMLSDERTILDLYRRPVGTIQVGL